MNNLWKQEPKTAANHNPSHQSWLDTTATGWLSVHWRSPIGIDSFSSRTANPGTLPTSCLLPTSITFSTKRNSSSRNCHRRMKCVTLAGTFPSQKSYVTGSCALAGAPPLNLPTIPLTSGSPISVIHRSRRSYAFTLKCAVTTLPHN